MRADGAVKKISRKRENLALHGNKLEKVHRYSPEKIKHEHYADDHQ